MMNTHKGDIVVQAARRMALLPSPSMASCAMVGSRGECERRAAILATNNDRAAQDQALLRWVSLSR